MSNGSPITLKKKKELRGFSPQANYTDRAIAAAQRTYYISYVNKIILFNNYNYVNTDVKYDVLVFC
jgi:hypothetical protein